MAALSISSYVDDEGGVYAARRAMSKYARLNRRLSDFSAASAMGILSRRAMRDGFKISSRNGRLIVSSAMV